MFNQALYYLSGRGYNVEQVFHAIAMAWFAKITDGSQCSALRSALGFQSMARYTPSNAPTVMPQYVLAQDNLGYQIAIGQSGTLHQIWNQVGNPDLSTIAGVPGRYVSKFLLWAIYFADDIKARVPNTAPITIHAHGPSAAVAWLVGKLLQKDGWQLRTIFTSALPKFCDEGAYDAFTFQSVSAWFNGDWSPNLPPPCLSDVNFMAGDNPLPVLYRPSTMTVWGPYQNINQSHTNQLAPLRNVFGWAANIPESDPLNYDVAEYLRMLWERMNPQIQLNVIEWQVFLNGFFPTIFQLTTPSF